MDFADEVRGLYRYYCYYVHNKGKKENELTWYPSKFHVFLCDQVQKFLEKPTEKSYEILIINTPPQHGKSTTVSETFPSWFLMRNPDKKVILVSYNDQLAKRFGKRNLDKVKRYGPMFGVELDPAKRNPKEFRLNERDGVMISAGYGGSLTGNPADLIIIDDPIKNRVEADSERDRETKWQDYLDSIETRISAKGKIILIMTRWHEDDLAGRLMEHYEDRTTVLNLPCECEDENDLLGRKPVGLNGDDKVGDPLCPEIGKDIEWLRDFKVTHMHEDGIRSWNALYQGRPVAREGNVIERDWWQFYNRSDYLSGRMRLSTLIMSVDATFKDNEKNDFVCITVWGKIENRIYLIDLINKHLNFKATIRQIKVLKARYPKISSILIEDKANGSAIIQVLRDEILGIVPVQPDASKEARVNAVSFAIEAGNVYLPNDADFTFDFIDQCAAFPNGKHDDMVDSMSQGLARLIFSRQAKRMGKIFHNNDRVFTLPSLKKQKSTELGEKVNAL